MKDVQAAYEFVREQIRREKAELESCPVRLAVPMPDTPLAGVRLALEYLAILLPATVALWFGATGARVWFASDRILSVGYYAPELLLPATAAVHWARIAVKKRPGRLNHRGCRMRALMRFAFVPYGLFFSLFAAVTFVLVDLGGLHDDRGRYLESHGVWLVIGWFVLAVLYFAGGEQKPGTRLLVSGYTMLSGEEAIEVGRHASDQHIRAHQAEEQE